MDRRMHKKTQLDPWSSELKRHFLPSLTTPEVWNGPTSGRALVFALRKSSKWGAQDSVQKQREIRKLERDAAKSSLLSARRRTTDSLALDDICNEQIPDLGESALPQLKLSVPQTTELLGEYEHSGTTRRALKMPVKAHRKRCSPRQRSKWGAQDSGQKQHEIRKLERDAAKSSLLSARRGRADSPALDDICTEQIPDLGLNQMTLEVEHLPCELEKLTLDTAEPTFLSAPRSVAPSTPNAGSTFQLPAIGVSALPQLKLSVSRITELLGEYEHSGPTSRSLKMQSKAHRKRCSPRQLAV